MPIERKMPISRVLSVTTMIRVETMLKAATSTMSRRISAMPIFSSLSAEKRPSFICFQSRSV